MGEDCELGAVVDIEFEKESAEVGAHGGQGQVQLVGDPLVRVALCDEPGNFELARAHADLGKGVWNGLLSPGLSD